MIIDDAAPILDLDRLLDGPPRPAVDAHPEWSTTLRRLRDLDDDLAPPPGLELQTWASLMAAIPTQTAASISSSAAPAAPPPSAGTQPPHRRALVGFLAAATAASSLWLALLVPLRPTDPTDPTVPDTRRPPAVSSVASDVSLPPALADVAPAAPEPTAPAVPAGPFPTSDATVRLLPRGALTATLPGLSLASLTPSGLFGLAALGIDDAHREIATRQAEWETALADDQETLLQAAGLDDLVEATALVSWFHPA